MNDIETDQEEEKELAGPLAEKKLPTEGCTGRNGEREKSSRAAKFVKGKREDGNDTIKEIKWETLENRRRKTRITSLYREHLGQKAWVDITARLEKPTYYGGNDHDFKIKCRKQKTDVDNPKASFTLEQACPLISEKEKHNPPSRVPQLQQMFLSDCIALLENHYADGQRSPATL
ncbi:hypothetical protein ANN_20727 [Periplaneta americana]|uniref:Uncharacterized protein n=1 Tax=Periplaneta americana TaxID=6978 RepID=A0ABQ8SEP8_PERAM|nr:hypothetical protein ANN_20727 [Periplaneta americana]